MPAARAFSSTQLGNLAGNAFTGIVSAVVLIGTLTGYAGIPPHLLDKAHAELARELEELQCADASDGDEQSEPAESGADSLDSEEAKPDSESASDSQEADDLLWA